VNEMPVITAFLDASVLYPALLRNIFMRLAVRGVFRARWSAKVQDEWVAALIRNRPDIPQARIERTRHLMDSRINNALVDGYEHRVDSVALPDADDRHVLAAAIHCQTQVIVTANLRDFPDSTLADFGIEALHPDAFLLGLLESDQGEFVAALRWLRASLKNPPHTADMKRQGLTATADALSAFIESL
jgi:PIN domain